MDNRQVIVGVDDRIRLMSAMLSVTNYPEYAQQRKGHRPHAHAPPHHTMVVEFSRPPSDSRRAISTESGRAIAGPLYVCAQAGLSSQCTPTLSQNGFLRAGICTCAIFYEIARLQDLWDQEHSVWEQAQVEADSVLRGSDYYEFLEPFVGNVSEYLIYMPNISYPSETSVEGAGLG